MSYLLDTCVLSEATRSSPNPRVREFLNGLPSGSAWISCLTLAEVHKGIERLPESMRKRALRKWFVRELAARFEGQVVAIDEAVALRWANLLNEMETRGRVLPVVDSLIAATALHHALKLVTRNVADFDGTGVTVINPWT